MLNNLIACSDNAKSLAWIGGAIIKYTLLEEIWKPGLTTEVLHKKREALEKNENLSKLCDKWKLFEYRIHFDPDVPKDDDTLKKIKGTLPSVLYIISDKLLYRFI